MTRTLLQIEPTTRCNFTCGFCCGRQMRQGDLPFERFEEIVASHPDLEHVELQGEGEPLLHPRFFDMVALARSRGIGVSIITNGSQFTTANIERILEGGIHSINVSIESPDPAAFREIRGGKLSKVIDGVRALVTTRRERGLDEPIVGFAVTVLRRTLADADALVRLHRDLQLDGPMGVQPLQQSEAYTAVYDAEMRAQMLSPEEARAYHEATRANRELVQIRLANRAINFYHRLFENWSPRTGKCPWLERGGYVTIDGDVGACCFVKDPQYAFGRVGVDDLAKIDQARDELRRELRARNVPRACSSCGIARAIAQAGPPSE